MRLQKYLADCGVASRRGSESIIAEGRVTLNDMTVSEMGVQVHPGDKICVDGLPVIPVKEKHYLMYYKPLGEVTTVFDPEGRPTVMDKFRDYPVRLFPVGRLDYDSEGLLLLTNDGELTRHLLHPSRHVQKTYMAKVSKQLSDQALDKLRTGVIIDGRMTSPAKVFVTQRAPFYTSVLITVHEGRNRQIRKMIESVGHTVVSLRRVGFGPLKLGDLLRGTWRSLSEQEVKTLKTMGGSSERVQRL